MSRDSSELQLSLAALSSRDRGRPFGLATAAGLSAGRVLLSQPHLMLARRERRSVRQKRSRAQRARKLARAFSWSARSALVNPPGLEALRSGADTDMFLERVPLYEQPDDPFVCARTMISTQSAGRCSETPLPTYLDPLCVCVTPLSAPNISVCSRGNRGG